MHIITFINNDGTGFDRTTNRTTINIPALNATDKSYVEGQITDINTAMSNIKTRLDSIEN